MGLVPATTPQDVQGWVDPIQWVTTQVPKKIIDSLPASEVRNFAPCWCDQAGCLFFARTDTTGTSVWKCADNGTDQIKLLDVPVGQRLHQLLSYRGKPLVVLEAPGVWHVVWLNGKSPRVLKTFTAQGYLNQTLYEPDEGSWTWFGGGKVARFSPDGEVEKQGLMIAQSLSRGEVNSFALLSEGGKVRLVPIITKAGPATPWRQFSWTIVLTFPGDLPVVVLKNGELWLVTISPRYSVSHPGEPIEAITSQPRQLTNIKTHGEVSFFTMAAPERLYAVAGSNIFRLDFGSDQVAWEPITAKTNARQNPLREIKTKFEEVVDKIRVPLPW
jgi:hypothetical protein